VSVTGLCFHLQPASYTTASLINVLTQLRAFYAGERVVLIWDGLGAHWSHDMHAWTSAQDWLQVERLPAYAPELQGGGGLVGQPQGRGAGQLRRRGPHEVADATEQGIDRICEDHQLVWSFLAHTGLTLDHPTPTDFRKAQ
jgi:DDE superfamily endonuclease